MTNGKTRHDIKIIFGIPRSECTFQKFELDPNLTSDDLS